MKKLPAAALLAIILATWARGAVDGQWTIHLPDNNIEAILELRTDGTHLTGSLSGGPGKYDLRNGFISADTISFEAAAEPHEGTVTIQFVGKIHGDTIELTVRPPGTGAEEHWTATRRNPSASPPDWFAEAAAPPEVLGWVKANAIQLATVQPGPSFSDMEPLVSHLKGARIVAMGEATHATREFQQFKSRMFEFLVNKLGFTVFGIEANWPESLKINDYVLRGKGEPGSILSGQFLWWQTEDMRDLLLWMRHYNQDPAHTRKLKFFGFDMQGPGLAASNVLDYLGRVDSTYRDMAAQTFRRLGPRPENPEYEQAPPEVKRKTAASLSQILSRFDERKAAYIALSSLQEWTMARQNMVIVKQAEFKLANQNELGTASRDRAMAENVKWILDQEPPGTKMMLWAHNAHVAREGATPPMGGHLRQTFGKEFVSCGFLFQQGGFRAIDMNTRELTTFTVGAPPPGSLDRTLSAASLPLFALDLRTLPQGQIANWFNAPHVSRQIGGGYSEATPGIWFHRLRPAPSFDLLIFVAQTTPIRLL